MIVNLSNQLANWLSDVQVTCAAGNTGCFAYDDFRLRWDLKDAPFAEFLRNQRQQIDLALFLCSSDLCAVLTDDTGVACVREREPGKYYRPRSPTARDRPSCRPGRYTG